MKKTCNYGIGACTGSLIGLFGGFVVFMGGVAFSEITHIDERATVLAGLLIGSIVPPIRPRFLH